MSWFNDFSDIVREHVPLAPYTWFKLGGPARWLVEPRDDRELSAVLRRCADAGISTHFLGKGANLLVCDDGVDAAVIRLRGPGFEWVTESDRETGGQVRVMAAAGADLMDLVKQTSRRGLAGLEVLAGIPATVGGAVRMNCGGKYGEIATVVQNVRVISPAGEIHDRDDVRFHYRGNDLNGEFVMAVALGLTRGNPDEVYSRYETIWREKMACQPTLKEHCAGCIFRNPPGFAAGKLIDECGLKGECVGGAEVSRRHANFIVARDGASANDVFALIDVVRDRVLRERGVWLDLEVEVWGRSKPGMVRPHKVVMTAEMAKS